MLILYEHNKGQHTCYLHLFYDFLVVHILYCVHLVKEK